MRVADRMHCHVVTIDRGASLRRARRVMENHRIRHLPVVEGRRVVGILTDRDIRLAAPSSVASLTVRERDEFMDFLRVGQVMTRRIISVTPATSIGEAVRLLLRYRIGCLPVVEDHLLVGILTSSDIMEILVAILREEVAGDRVEVDVPDEPSGLESLLRIVGAHRARMLSLVNLPTAGGVMVRALLRIEGEADPLCAALGAAGFPATFRRGASPGDESILEHLGRS